MIDITHNSNSHNNNDDDDDDSQLRLTSVRFNTNNTQILCGSFQQFSNTKANIIIYDLEKQQNQKIEAHNDDINTICYADRENTNNNVFLSGGDTNDCNINVWDS